MIKTKINQTEQLATTIDAILDKKGKEPVSLNLREMNEAITDYFIVCHGDSPTQVAAIANHVLMSNKEKYGIKPHYSEGFGAGEWVLLDYLDIVVHVFLKEKRGFYQLEDLWSDGEVLYYAEDGTLTKK